MPQVHFNIKFEIVSQRFNNDNILVEQACANIKNKQTFVNFYCINIVAFCKSLDFVMFETKNVMHTSAELKMLTTLINYHMCPIFHAENNLSKLQFNFTHSIGSILTLRGPTPLNI
jgi:hypothetical protein